MACGKIPKGDGFFSQQSVLSTQGGEVDDDELDCDDKERLEEVARYWGRVLKPKGMEGQTSIWRAMLGRGTVEKAVDMDQNIQAINALHPGMKESLEESLRITARPKGSSIKTGGVALGISFYSERWQKPNLVDKHRTYKECIDCSRLILDRHGKKRCSACFDINLIETRRYQNG